MNTSVRQIITGILLIITKIAQMAAATEAAVRLHVAAAARPLHAARRTITRIIHTITTTTTIISLS